MLKNFTRKAWKDHDTRLIKIHCLLLQLKQCHMIAVANLITLWSINIYDSHLRWYQFWHESRCGIFKYFFLSCDIMLIEDTKEVTKYFKFNCFSLTTFLSGLLDPKLFKYPDLDESTEISSNLILTNYWFIWTLTLSSSCYDIYTFQILSLSITLLWNRLP